MFLFRSTGKITESRSNNMSAKVTKYNKPVGQERSVPQQKQTQPGSKPYTCTQCRKCFTRSGNLTKHQRLYKYYYCM